MVAITTRVQPPLYLFATNHVLLGVYVCVLLVEDDTAALRGGGCNGSDLLVT